MTAFGTPFRAAPRAAAGGVAVRPVWWVALGGAALALGLLVYLTERDPARVMLMPAVAVLSTGALFGSAGAWLPSLVHPFAFSLFSAAAMRPRPSPPYAVCAAWWAVNLGFEAAQHPRLSAPIAAALQHAGGDLAPVRMLSAYLVQGGFDSADLLASTAGALAAAAVLWLSHRRESDHGP